MAYRWLHKAYWYKIQTQWILATILGGNLTAFYCEFFHLKLDPLTVVTEMKNPTGQDFSLCCVRTSCSISATPRPENIGLYHTWWWFLYGEAAIRITPPPWLEYTWCVEKCCHCTNPNTIYTSWKLFRVWHHVIALRPAGMPVIIPTQTTSSFLHFSFRQPKHPFEQFCSRFCYAVLKPSRLQYHLPQHRSY